MQIVPLTAVPSQTVAVQLGGQNCNLNVYWTSYGLFMDVYSNGSLIIAGVSCLNQNRIVRNSYLGFSGDLFWIDNTGAGADPVYTGIGTTYSLAYVTPAELASAGIVE